MHKQILLLYIVFNLLLKAFAQDYSIEKIKISWKDNGDSTNFTITNTMANNNWFAFGLSNDQFMVILFKLNKF